MASPLQPPEDIEVNNDDKPGAVSSTGPVQPRPYRLHGIVMAKKKKAKAKKAKTAMSGHMKGGTGHKKAKVKTVMSSARSY